MHKPISTFSWSTTLFVVLILQVIAIGVLASGLITTGSQASATISLLPPLNFLYTAADVLWVGAGAAIALVICATFDLIVAVCCFWYASARKLKLIKYVVMMMGVHFFVVCLVNLAAVGLIVYGGWWHALLLIGLIVTAITATAMGVMFLIAQGSLRQLGQAHDLHIAKLGERELLE